MERASHIIKKNPVIILACVITLIVYSRFLFFGHISWDDPEMVFRNADVQNFDVRAFFTKQYVGNYIPFTMLVHAISWLLFQDSDAGHHLTSILFHILNGILLWKLTRKMFSDKGIADLSAIVFLLHPLQVESVGWISELKNTLSGSFFILSLYFYVRYLLEKKQLFYLSSFLLFGAGGLSKSSVIILPLCLLCVELMFKKRLEWKDTLNKLPFLMVALLLGLINIKSQTEAQFINYAHNFPIPERIGYAGFALLKYLLLFIAPVNLSVIYPYPEKKMMVLIAGYLLLIALITFISVSYRKKEYTWMALPLFIFFTLVLVLQFIPFGEVLYADRYMYLPLIGFGWVIALCLNSLRMPAQSAGALLSLVFAVMTFARVEVWKSSLSLYEDILKKYPGQFIALNSAGVESMFLNQDQQALEYFDRAIIAAPKNYKGYYNRGLLYLKNQRPEQALQSFNQTLALYEYDKALAGRASAHYLMNNIPKAIEDAKSAISLSPGNPRPYFVLGNCYNDLNKLDEAIKNYNKAIALSPGEADYFFKRAIAYGKKQDFRQCFDDLNICLSLNDKYYEAYYWRGVAKVNLNQDPCPDLEIAARQNFEPALQAYNKYCR